MKMTRSVIWAALLPVLALGCAGKGDVSGTVTCGGKTVSSGTVTFVASDLMPYQAQIEEDGSYTLLQVPVGEARIGVSSPRPTGSDRPLTKDDGRPPPIDAVEPPQAAKVDLKKWVQIPKEYESFETSGLTFEVRRGKSRCDIDLKAKP